VTADACDKLFTAATPPKGGAPADTLTADEAVARYPWYVPQRLFTLLGHLYPVAQGQTGAHTSDRPGASAVAVLQLFLRNSAHDRSRLEAGR
jgi:hypothetical protein